MFKICWTTKIMVYLLRSIFIYNIKSLELVFFEVFISSEIKKVLLQ